MSSEWVDPAPAGSEPVDKRERKQLVRELERTLGRTRSDLTKKRRRAEQALRTIEQDLATSERKVDEALSRTAEALKLNSRALLDGTRLRLNGREHQVTEGVRAWAETTGSVNTEQGWVFKSDHDRRQVFLNVQGPGWSEVVGLRGTGMGAMIGIDTNHASLSDALRTSNVPGDVEAAARRFAGAINAAWAKAPADARATLTAAASADRIAAGLAYAAWYGSPDRVRLYNEAITETASVERAVANVELQVPSGDSALEERARRAVAEARGLLAGLRPIERTSGPPVRPSGLGALRLVPADAWSTAWARMTDVLRELGEDEQVLALFVGPAGELVGVTQVRLLAFTDEGVSQAPFSPDVTWERDERDTFAIRHPAGIEGAGLRTRTPDRAARVLELWQLAGRADPAGGLSGLTPLTSTQEAAAPRQAPAAEPGSPEPEPSPAQRLAGELRELAALRDEGLLTPEEFAEQKAEALRRSR